jgi:uncharacterized protein (TIGR00290 family)
MTRKAVFAWSGGKDSALALWEIRRRNNYHIVALLTTVTRDYDRVSMHGVRTELIEQQADALDLPLNKIYLEKDSDQKTYETKMKAYLQLCRDQGVECVVFGDIFLQDVRQYREENLAKVGMDGVFPLWQRNTTELAHFFIDRGFEALITCADGQALSGDFVGRRYDRPLLADLPDHVDPCGERGEFHSFVYNGPIFDRPIPIETGPAVLREERFHFIDVTPSPADIRYTA